MIIKIKGLIKNSLNNITFDMLLSLLHKDNFLELEQEKWYKSLENANIEVLKQIYTLKVTDNKRKLIYKNNILIDTEPYIINEKKEIIN